MPEKYKSHYPELVDNVRQKERDHAKGIAVSIIPSLMQRTDGPGVFTEGESFSGMETRGKAEACFTTAASAYVLPRIPRDGLISASESTLGRPVSLPENMGTVSELPSHLIVWWRRKEENGDGQADILWLAKEGPDERRNFTEMIERQVVRASRILQQASGQKPIIQSSWGHGTPAERARDGKSRGGPSNKHGHLHVLDFKLDQQEIKLKNDLIAREKLNQYGPWNALAHRILSVPIARGLGAAAHKVLNQGVTTEAFSDFYQGEHGTSSYRDGYRLIFDRPIDFGTTFNCLIEIAGTFESFYQQIAKHHETYYKHASNSSARMTAETAIRREGIKLGFTELEASRFVPFVLGIRPTYGQLKNWREELSQVPEDGVHLQHVDRLIERYERVAQRIGEANRYSLHSNLIRETLTPPEQFKEIQNVWPVHLGASFEIEDYSLNDHGMVVKSINLLPNIDTIKGIEYFAGALLKRAKGATA